MVGNIFEDLKPNETMIKCPLNKCGLEPELFNKRSNEYLSICGMNNKKEDI
jgi:hypothetical protein